MPIADDIARFRDDPAVADLDFSMFSDADLANIALQRWDVLFDVPRFRNTVFGAWTRGDPAPLAAAVRDKGVEIAYRAAASVYAEYLEMGPVLDRLAPKSIADIGSGYALFDLFVARDRDATLLLIDIESNENTHFVFAEEASAYNDLSVARAMIEANGVPSDRIVTLNPLQEDLTETGTVDFACSWISCGFHYPLSTYAAFFRDQVAPGGAVSVDINPKHYEAEAAELARIGTVEEIWRNNGAVRVLAVKQV